MTQTQHENLFTVTLARTPKVGRPPLVSNRAGVVLEALPEPRVSPQDLMSLVEEAYTYRGRVPLYAYQDLLRDVVELRDVGLAKICVDGQARMDLRPLAEPEIARLKRAGSSELVLDSMTVGAQWRISNILFERVLSKPPQDHHLHALWQALGAWPCRLEDMSLAPQQWEHWRGLGGCFWALMGLHQAGSVRVTPV